VINFVGGKPVPIPLREESGFGFDLDVLEKSVSRKTKLIIINSPQNPTGGVLEVEQLGRIAEIARTYRIPVLADEIYKSFLYEGEFASITRFPGMKDLVIILDGFSKSFAMTGWRLGYGVMPVALAEHVTRLMVNSNSCTASSPRWRGSRRSRATRRPCSRWWPSSSGGAMCWWRD
jgi:aspartate/methionine/tyrosine aminotransferase